MRSFRPKLLVLAVAAALAATGLGGPAAAQAAPREYEGTVVSIDWDKRSFRLKDSERGTIRIKVRSSTRFERIAGFRALKVGMQRVEAVVRRSGGAWVAIEVERSGGGGEHGDGDDDGDDDEDHDRHGADHD